MLEKMLKKILPWKSWTSGLIIGLILALGVTVSAFTIDGSVDEIKMLFGQVKNEEKETSLGNITLDKYYLDSGGITASTTPKYQTSATSTLTMSVANAKHIDLNINLQSTSTVPTLYWVNSFSSDVGSNKNWFPETGYTATSNVLETIGASPLIHTWTPSATTTVGEVWRKNRGIEPVASRYMRTQLWTGGANADLYVEGITQVLTSD